MRRSHWIISGVAAAALLATASVGVGCGKSSGTGGAGTSGGGTEPPARPSGAKAGDSSGKQIFAVSKIYLGTTDRMGNPDANAWKNYGYDLDNMIVPQTTTDFSKHCTGNGASATPKAVFPDGNGGIDNSFGKNILPIVKSVAGSGDIQATLNTAIQQGKFSVLIDLSTLGTGDTYSPITGFLAGANKPNMTDSGWTLIPETLKPGGTTIDQAQVSFQNSYLVKNTWVSGDKGTVTLSLAIGGYSLDLSIRSALVTMDLSADHMTATNGVIAGVINTEEFISALGKIAGKFNLCPGTTTFESIANSLRANSDINSDGTQHAGQMCDGISIGLGFDATAATVMGVGAPAMPGTDSCMTTATTGTGTGTTTTGTGTGTGSGSTSSTGTGG